MAKVGHTFEDSVLLVPGHSQHNQQHVLVHPCDEQSGGHSRLPHLHYQLSILVCKLIYERSPVQRLSL